MIRQYRIKTRRSIVRRIARTVWAGLNAWPHAPLVVVLVALYFINR